MTIKHFGTTTKGEPVQRIAMTNGALRVSLLTLGATRQGLLRDGTPTTCLRPAASPLPARSASPLATTSTSAAPAG